MKKELEQLKQSFQLLEDKVKISLRSASETELKPEALAVLKASAQ